MHHTLTSPFFKAYARRVTLSLVVLLSLSSFAYAQAALKVTGTVTDKDSKGMDAATVALLKSTDSSFVKAELTDEHGHYEIAADAGSYLLRIISPGYSDRFVPAFTISANMEIPVVVMEKKEVSLKEVAVVSKKPMIEIKADKTVFNVENSINATGSNALELLKKSPGMQVDNNDNITMKGKNGVKIYIDGKPTQLDAASLASYLKSINSNDIEAIEMISNPSAKYDASGNAGIVNIKLKKNKKFLYSRNQLHIVIKLFLQVRIFKAFFAFIFQNYSLPNFLLDFIDLRNLVYAAFNIYLFPVLICRIFLKLLSKSSLLVCLH